jgi:sec-independent protein translocase protein TatA
MTPLFAFLGPMQLAVLAIIGVLLFGRKLPELARSLGKSLTEFKKGMHGLESGFDEGVAAPPVHPTSVAADPVRPPQRVAPTAPKFDDTPPPVQPK